MQDAVETQEVENTEADTQTVTQELPAAHKMKYIVKELKPEATEPSDQSNEETQETQETPETPESDETVEADPVEAPVEEAPASDAAKPAPTKLTKWRKQDNTLDEDRLEQLEKIAEAQAAELAYLTELQKKDPEAKRAILRAHKAAGGTLRAEDEAFLVPPKPVMSDAEIKQKFGEVELREGTAAAQLWFHNTVVLPSQEAQLKQFTAAEREQASKRQAEADAAAHLEASDKSVKTELAQAAKQFPKLFKANKENKFGYDLIDNGVEQELHRLKMDPSISISERVEIAMDRIARRTPKKKAPPQAPLRGTTGQFQRTTGSGATMKFRVMGQ